MNTTTSYVGRFAPSPTGPLHFGSLLAAAASYLQARSNAGRWLVRIEDIDPPRAQAGATALILKALEIYGFEWDGEVTYQSANRDRHLAVVEELIHRKLAYRCGCSRRDLAEVPAGPLGKVYPGNCRDGTDAREYAIRVLTDNRQLDFVDVLQGRQAQRLESESGDFVILRRDGLIAYNLAVVIDDADQGISEVVRGIDLLDSTPRHIYLQQLLNFDTPDYFHIPVAENRLGQKLSKLTGAPGLPLAEPRPQLLAALRSLGQATPTELANSSIADIWRFAISQWNPQVLAGLRSLPCDADTLAAPENGLS
ncbi:MAG: tRNA glutamyl-Q(34) synthetase GluQRS [Woeseia sp.]|nr:tRNA glutamyl-Q(34) synthetase GluQRS [Woeseia sp.]NNL56101.1 tRNA glutamyl-Q(34) synthetase GluQRS [Woeseia sp.]